MPLAFSPVSWRCGPPPPRLRRRRRRHRARPASARLRFEVGRRDPAAAIDERELERLAVGKVGEARLLDRGDVDEHVLAAVIADDEAEALLRVEEFDDALAFANDLGGHAAATAATAAETTAAAATAAAEATAAAAAAEAATATAAAAAAAEAAAIAIAADRRRRRSRRAPGSRQLAEIAFVRRNCRACRGRARRGPPCALYRNPCTVRTYMRPPTPRNQRARAKWRNRSWRVIHSRTVQRPYRKNYGGSSDSNPGQGWQGGHRGGLKRICSAWSEE